MARMCLCLNQVARLRNLNKRKEPDPVAVAIAAEIAGIDGLVVQFSETRDDITDRDVEVLKHVVQTHLNIAVALNDEMIKKCIHVLPDMVTLLPSSSNESTKSEDSLNIQDSLEYIEDVVAALHANNIVISALIAPDAHQIRAAARAGIDYVQINTHSLAHVDDLGTLTDRIEQIRSVALAANKLGLGISAGRGLSFQLLRGLGDIPQIEEFNIGRAAIARSVLVGIEKMVEQLKNPK